MLRRTLKTLLPILYYTLAFAGWIVDVFLYAIFIASATSFVIGGSVAFYLGCTGDWSLLPLMAGSGILTFVLWGLRKVLEILKRKSAPNVACLGEWVSNL